MSLMTTAHHVEHVMGTAVSIDVVGPDGHSAIDELVAWFHHVDSVFSPFIVDSPISRLGRGEQSTADPELSADIREVLARCDELRVKTHGVFDVWSLPSPNGTRFDPCGYVKGWSVQRATEILRTRGATDFCINAGGDVAVSGATAAGHPWRVGVRDPVVVEAIAFAVCLEGPLAVATSGCYERGAHIVDPRTGRFVDAFASATVVGPSAADADAYATTLFIMGTEGLQWLVDRTEYSGCLITHDRRLLSTDRFDSYVTA
jgi:thiamine biosynthesis lipoprotein